MNKVMCFVFLMSMNCLSLIADERFEDQPLDWNDPKWAWMDKQITQDFFAFEHDGALNFLPFEAVYEKKGITEHMLNCVMGNAPTISFGEAFARFQIIDGKVYGPEGESSVNPGQGEASRLLKKIVKLYPVPDVDIIIHGQDVIFNHWDLQGPVLVTCKSGGCMQILFPVQLWELWVYFADQVEKACDNSSWENKISKYFWRGKPNDADNYFNREMWTKYRRGKFCYLSQKFPDLIDAAFTAYNTHSVASDSVEEFFAFFPKKEVSWFEYVNHKYLVDLDGYVASTPGYAWKLLSNCAVFKHESPYYVWFYGALEPWIHYVPFKADLSDIFEKLEWAKTHDEQVRQIAENSRRFAKENLLPEHLYLYCYKVLLKYASLQRFTPKIRTP